MALANTVSRHRPLVVLAGWLGSQPKSLRRYEELYRTMGFKVVLTRIAPPYAIVQTCLADPPLEAIDIPVGWPSVDSSTTKSDDGGTSTSKNFAFTTVQRIAWDILHSVHQEDCSSFYFHAFSNGGCFVWEQCRRILLEAPVLLSSNAKLLEQQKRFASPATFNPESVVDALSRLRNNLSGVIFDSCPVLDMSRLDQALNHCSESERDLLHQRCGTEFDRDIMQTRMNAYSKGLRNDPLHIPHLYLFSRDDELAPAVCIEELISHRREVVVDPHRVANVVWDESMHCGHLLKHPREYTDALRNFVQMDQVLQAPQQYAKL